MEYTEVDPQSLTLIEAARDVIKSNFEDGKYTVGSAVLCQSGKIYVGVNIDTCGFGPCAEPVALGAAICNGERKFLTIVAVGGPPRNYDVMLPCGNCRQLLMDHAPDIMVIIDYQNKLVKVKLGDLLPLSFQG
jgi:cytidine deaminase